MCVEPNIMTINGEQVAASCRKCWQCLNARLEDYIGRCVAEQQTASQTFAAALTYEGDEANTVVLIYKDVQDFMKRLRRAGYNARYIVAGEYGAEKGRAHWHIVLFLYGKQLKIVQKPEDRSEWDVILPRFKDDPWARIHWKPWSDYSNNGFCYFQLPDYGGIHYAVKYALKDQGAGSSKAFGFSKEPPLGHFYFLDLAERYVQQGLVPDTESYQFTFTVDGEERTKRFQMRGKTIQNFWAHFLKCWVQKYGAEPHPDQIGELATKRIDEYHLRDGYNLSHERLKLENEINRKRRKAKIDPFDLYQDETFYLDAIEDYDTGFHVSFTSQFGVEFVNVYHPKTKESLWHGKKEEFPAIARKLGMNPKNYG